MRESSSVVHLLAGRGGSFAAALCGLMPERDWFRQWEQSFDTEPIGLCRACWHLRAEASAPLPTGEPTSEAT